MKYKGIMPALSLRQAETRLVDEFVWALKHRAEQFEYSFEFNDSVIKDKGTDIKWRMPSSKYGTGPVGGNLLLWWNRRRATKALQKWIVSKKSEKQRILMVQYLMDMRVTNHPQKDGVSV